MNSKNAVSTAYGHLMMNLMVLPGIGSWMGGKRKTGVAQILLSFLGTLFIIVWLAMWISKMIETKTFIVEPDLALAVGAAGIVLFLGAWGWSFHTGMLFVKAAQSHTSPPPLKVGD